MTLRAGMRRNTRWFSRSGLDDPSQQMTLPCAKSGGVTKGTGWAGGETLSSPRIALPWLEPPFACETGVRPWSTKPV